MSNNLSRSTIAGSAPGTSGTTFTVAAGHGVRLTAGKALVYPAGAEPDPSNAEVVTLPAPSGDTFTGVVRTSELLAGQGAPSPRSIGVGDVIVQGITAAMWDGLSGTYAPLAADWTTGRAYVVGQMVLSGGTLYRCTTAHTAGGSFAPANFAAVATIAGALSPTSTKTTAYTAAVGELVLADVTSAPFTVTLPSNPAIGALVGVKNVTPSVPNTLTIAPAGSGTIDGDATATTNVPKVGGGTFQHLGSDVWKVVGVYTANGPVGPTGLTGPTGATGPAGPGVAAGGTTGQALVKTSNADYATGWATPSASVPSSALFGVRSGNYMRVPQVAISLTSASASSGALYAVPFLLTETVTVTKLGVMLWALGSTGALIRLGIYNDANGYPGTVAVDAGTMDASPTGGAITTIKAITLGSSVALSPGTYWSAFVIQGSPSTTPNVICVAAASSIVSLATIPAGLGGYTTTGVTGALPSTFPAGGGTVRDMSNAGNVVPAVLIGA